jgi:serine/threonine protein kinase/tetratricopeptide (TPR) repeat protein
MSDSENKAKSIFLTALELTAAAGREAYIAEQTAGNTALRRDVEELLRHATGIGDFLESPARAAISLEDDARRTDFSGSTIGPYKLLQVIGEGGMGAVYMAEQTAPVQRKVALKIIKPGMDSRQVIARFEAERQALALMDHPNIAKVLDGGATDNGRPYFVMELVKGVPITRYCDEYHLTPKERLELFVPVCQAVQHAHQKGIIHRDLKPSNVMICLYDGRPVPKVIDFGVAKATGHRLTERTLFTEFGAVIGTLEYMSPEQAELNNQDIDTRSDIYSLGVLLYELLTGTTPLCRDRLKQAAFTEMLRIIREEEPQKPSTRLSTSRDSLPAISAQRQMEPTKLTRLVRGELDWIVMKALEKNRGRRYETANSLATDVQRYLCDEPVLAGPPTARYRIRKFFRKHRAEVLAAIAFIVLLLAGTGISIAQAVRATRAERDARAAAAAEALAHQAEADQRRQAEAVAGLLESAFQGLDPKEAALDLKGELVGRLNAVASNLDSKFAGEPLVRARLRHAVGVAQRGIGEPQSAVILLNQALAERREHLGPDHVDTLLSMRELGSALQDAGQFEAARQQFEQVLAKRRTLLGPDDAETLASVRDLGIIYQDLGRPADARPLFEHVLERRTALLGSDHLQTLEVVTNLAGVYKVTSQPSRALSMYQRAYEGTRKQLGPDHPDTLTNMNQMALTYQDMKQLDKALPLLKEVLDRRRARLGPDHPRTLNSVNNLALAFAESGRFDEALPMHQETLERRRAKLGPDHPLTLNSLNNLALLYRDMGRLDEAIAMGEDVVQRRRAKLGIDDAHTLNSLNNLALAYKDAGRLDRAIPLYEETLERRRATLGPNHRSTFVSMYNLAVALGDSGDLERANSLLRELIAQKSQVADSGGTIQEQSMLGLILVKQSHFAEAETLLRENLATRQKQQPDNWRTFQVESMLGAALSGQSKFAEAETHLLQGYEGMKSREARIPAPQREPRLSEALDRLVRFYAAWEKPNEAARWRKELEDLKGTQKKSPN